VQINIVGMALAAIVGIVLNMILPEEADEEEQLEV
jgi:xanthine/uracil permease